ncbi:MAG TPA: hypothetical protein VK308_15565 [Pyrinomonadaceae bacterium]|nr:hypothetical protein [Pyrinomonadaceae bacterium]
MIINAVQRTTREGRTVYKPLRDYFNPREFAVEKIDFNTAKDFVCKFHYAKSVGAVRRSFGLFRKSELVGVAIYAHPVNDLTITNTLRCDRPTDGVELNRLVLLDEILSNAESFFVAEAHRRLKREGFAGVVSFADDTPRTSEDGETSFRGHLGICYRAGNAALTGRGTPRTLRLLPDGTVFSDRTAQKIRASEPGHEYGARILESFGASGYPEEIEARKVWLKFWLDRITRKLKHPGNLRYAWSFSKKVQLKSLPYPQYRFSDRQLALNF